MEELNPTHFPSPFDNVNEASTLRKFNVQFLRRFEVQIEADSLATAERLAREVLKQFPADSVRLLSIIPEGYIEPADEPKTADVSERRNAQLAVKVRELTDQPEPDRAA